MGGPLYIAAFATGTTLLLLLLALLARPRLRAELREGNDAERLAAAGELLAVFLLAGSAVRDGAVGTSAGQDAAACAVYGALGLAASALAGRLGVRLLLGGSLASEVARGNVAAGVAAAGHLLASAIVTSRSMVGSDLHAIGLSIAFFGIGQLTLLAFVTLFRALTTYDDAEQIHGENLAAAVSYAGVAVAVALIVARALEGDFAGWPASLRAYGGVLVSLLALWPVRQLFVQTLLLRAPLTFRGGILDATIAQRRSAGLAALEAVTYVASALVAVDLT
ncbi:MAG: DUF350 domain-containing protein [Myxococcales bacterium]|nr:DUF350 domain-containing protein [Myxococcales bacterium]